MEIPSVMIAYLQQIFSEVSDSDIATAEPRTEFPEQSDSVRKLGVATEEMQKWWLLAKQQQDMTYPPMDIFLLPEEERESIISRTRLADANHDLLQTSFRALVVRMFGNISPIDDLVMYKGWIMGTLMPQSRSASSEHGGHPCHVNHQF
jgi:hypothetical protein